MAIACNGAQNFSRGVQHFGATAYLSAIPHVLQGNFAQTNRIRNLTAGEGITSDMVGLPSGYSHPSAWMMPQKAGMIASRNIISGEGDATITMVSGVNGEATLSGTGSLTGTGALIVSLVAAISGSGTISSAVVLAYLQLASSLAGSGDLTGTANALGHAAAALSGAGDVSSTARATGTLAAQIVVTGDLLNTSNVGQAVWEYMIEAGYTAEQILRIIAAQAAGAATGLEGANPQFTGLDGTTLRIDGSYSSGTRTIDSLNGD